MLRMTVNELLTAARERLDRVEPLAALAAVEHGAVIIDIRSETQRQTDGVIPGALFYERNVLGGASSLRLAIAIRC